MPSTDGRSVVVGLGNPGPRYDGTRHNVGFACLDLLAKRAGMRFADKRQHVFIGEGSLAGQGVVLAKPRTFMNASGLAARYLLDRFGVRPERMLVVYDDMDLPLGALRVRAQGSSGGHNGLNSINAEVGTSAYPRVRIGIGRPAHGAIEHVLAHFSKEEQAVVDEALGRAADAVETWLTEGIDAAMNRFN
ncbi:MAG: aminoacyl-tRNA hydrolase [Chloroflexota bacterium]